MLSLLHSRTDCVWRCCQVELCKRLSNNGRNVAGAWSQGWRPKRLSPPTVAGYSQLKTECHCLDREASITNGLQVSISRGARHDSARWQQLRSPSQTRHAGLSTGFWSACPLSFLRHTLTLVPFAVRWVGSQHNDKDHVQWTYADLDRGARRLATALNRTTHIERRPIAALIHNQAEWALLYWAAAYLHSPFVPINPKTATRTEEINHMLDLVGPVVLVTANLESKYIDGCKA